MPHRGGSESTRVLKLPNSSSRLEFFAQWDFRLTARARTIIPPAKCSVLEPLSNLQKKGGGFGADGEKPPRQVLLAIL